MVIVPLVMITLRCTKKLRQHLGIKPETEDAEPTSALGDWYGNLVFMPRGRPLILITNERTLLSVVLRHGPDVLAEFKQRVIALLRRLEIPKEAVERETFHLQQIRIGKTKNRRVLGSMNEAGLQLKVDLLDTPHDPAALEQTEDVLAETLRAMINHKHPSDVARELLGAPARPRPRRPLVMEPEAGHVPEVGSLAKAGPEPYFASAMELVSLVLNGPSKKRIKISEEHKVPVKLSARDRELIIEYAALDPELTAPLEKVPPEAGVLNVGYTLGDLDELRGCIAAGANHCKIKKLQKELDGLYDRLRVVMESYDDGGWQN